MTDKPLPVWQKVEKHYSFFFFCSSYQWHPRSPKQTIFLKVGIFRAYLGIFQISRDRILPQIPEDCLHVSEVNAILYRFLSVCHPLLLLCISVNASPKMKHWAIKPKVIHEIQRYQMLFTPLNNMVCSTSILSGRSYVAGHLPGQVTVCWQGSWTGIAALLSITYMVDN